MNNSFYKIKNSKTRSISMENISGAKGEGGKALVGANLEFANGLGQGYKISPCVNIGAHSSFTIADIKDSGQITHIWLTLDSNQVKKLNINVYYDGLKDPAISCPLSLFFAIPNGTRQYFDSSMITINPGFGLSSWWPMPFRKGIKIVITNNNETSAVLYFQIDYELRTVEDDECYLHTFVSTSAPLKEKENHVILPTLKGKGCYVGTIMDFETDFITWWGEGEIKCFLDGDDKFPTICGTGTEDYFLGAWNFEDIPGHYQKFMGQYAGLTEIVPYDAYCIKNQKFAMYRFHILDPIRFEEDIRVEIQSIGWDDAKRVYRLQKNNITTLCFVYLLDK